MSDALYTAAKKAFLDADIDLLVDDIRGILVDAADYTFSAAHDFLDDVPAGARVSTSGAMTGKTTTGGVFDADDLLFSGVSGDESEAIILYKHTGTESTSNLIAYLDSYTGLPVTPNGKDIYVSWSNGANKIFAL